MGGKIQGYLTVYLSIVLAIILSLFLTLFEGARRNTIRTETEVVMDISMNSIMAEYHRELFHQYNLLAIDSSYGTDVVGMDHTAGRLDDYLMVNMTPHYENLGILSSLWFRNLLCMYSETPKMTEVSILTDYNGQVFRNAAAKAICDDVGMEAFLKFCQWLQVIQINDLENQKPKEERKSILDQLAKYTGKEVQIEEDLWKELQVDNPTQQLDEQREADILQVVFSDTSGLSQKELSGVQMIYDRMQQNAVSVGNASKPSAILGSDLLEQFLFFTYCTRYFGHYGQEKQAGALTYQMEYLLAGKQKDTDNLRDVMLLIGDLREMANMIYLYQDSVKNKEAEAIAQVLAAIILMPETMELFKALVIMGWAYAESIYDLKQLYNGKRVPLLKTSTTWHSGLLGALRGEMETEEMKTTGLCYEDYLILLSALQDPNVIVGRAMNLVESDIRQTSGNSHFRLDACYVSVQAKVTVKSTYGYEFMIERKKQY